MSREEAVIVGFYRRESEKAVVKCTTGAALVVPADALDVVEEVAAGAERSSRLIARYADIRGYASPRTTIRRSPRPFGGLHRTASVPRGVQALPASRQLSYGRH